MLSTCPRLPSPFPVLLLGVSQELWGPASAGGEAAAPMHPVGWSSRVPARGSLVPRAAEGWWS